MAFGRFFHFLQTNFCFFVDSGIALTRVLPRTGIISRTLRYCQPPMVEYQVLRNDGKGSHHHPESSVQLVQRSFACEHISARSDVVQFDRHDEDTLTAMLEKVRHHVCCN